MLLASAAAAEVNDRLREIDWDFDQASTQASVHNLHPYPAKFIPEIPRELIRLFRPESGAVLDPFCGSGTTLVEAQTAGLDTIGVDLHPLATLISRVKTGPALIGLNLTAVEVIEAARSSSAEIPDIPRLDHWFMPHVQDALARLRYQIELLGSNPLADALWVGLSRIIVRVSNQESDTRYAAVAKTVTYEDVFNLFHRAVQTISAALSDRKAGTNSSLVRVLTKDILETRGSDISQNVGLVITSPPYPNAYEYWLYHKYRMYWLGMDPISVRTHEIGARPHYFKKNHQTEVDFENQMMQCFKLLKQVMRPKGVACFLVGRSIIHGRHIDNAALLRRAAEPSGFESIGTVDRKIRRSRKSFAHGSIQSETILVLRLNG